MSEQSTSTSMDSLMILLMLPQLLKLIKEVRSFGKPKEAVESEQETAAGTNAILQMLTGVIA